MSAPVEFPDVQIYAKILNLKEIQDYADCNAER